mgnify:CR=1
MKVISTSDYPASNHSSVNSYQIDAIKNYAVCYLSQLFINWLMIGTTYQSIGHQFLLTAIVKINSVNHVEPIFKKSRL